MGEVGRIRIWQSGLWRHEEEGLMVPIKQKKKKASSSLLTKATSSSSTTKRYISVTEKEKRALKVDKV